MMLDNSANAEVQFQEPKDGGVLDVVISCSEGSNILKSSSYKNISRAGSKSVSPENIK